MTNHKVAIIMGSKSDFNIMENALPILNKLGIAYDVKIVSAHRTPDRLYEFAKNADKEYSCIIAGAGGAAHLPGMVAALTWLPVFGVPVNATSLNGLDSLLSIVQMPAGIPVNSMSIGISGAKNAAFASAALIAVHDLEVRKKLIQMRQEQTDGVAETIEFTS